MHEDTQVPFAISPTRPEGTSIAPVTLRVDKLVFQIYVVKGSNATHLPELYPYELADDPVPSFVALYLDRAAAVAKRRSLPLGRKNRIFKRMITAQDMTFPVFVLTSRINARRVAVTLSDLVTDYSKSQNTLHFSARLHINGEDFVSDVRNDGTGANHYQWGTEPHHADVGRKLEEAAARLAPIAVKNDVVPANLDLVLSPLVNGAVTVLYMYVVDGIDLGLTREERNEAICQAIRDGKKSYEEIGKEYGVDRRTVGRLI